MEAFSSATVTWPQALTAAIASGSMEIREQLNYNGANLSLALFAVTPGAASPTVLTSLPLQSLITTTQIMVDRTYASSTPSQSVLVAGTVVSSQPKSPYGDLTGAPASLSFSYVIGKPAKYTSIVSTIAGIVTSYSASATGTLTFPPPPVPPPGAGTGPQIVITPPNQMASIKFLTLDASATTDAQKLSMTFSWRCINKSVAISGQNSAVANVQLSEGAGDYIFELTVTDTAGVVAKATTIISYVGH